MKKRIIVLSMAFLMLFAVTGCNKKTNKGLENNSDIQANSSLSKVTKDVDGLRFSNIALVRENGMTVVTADVTNTTSETITLDLITVVLKDADGNVLSNLSGDIGASILAGVTTSLYTSTDTDLMNATSVDFVVLK